RPVLTGWDHGQMVAAKLHDVADSIRVITLPDLPDKGDVSDWLESGKGKADVVSACKSAPVWAPATMMPAVPAEPVESDGADAEPTGRPFRPLGYSGNSYFYLPRGTEQVAEIKKGSHTSPAEMMSLASLEWWEMAYPKGDKGGTDWYAAASDMMRSCEQRGIYSQERERGRGAWYDKGRAVLHLGNHL